MVLDWNAGVSIVEDGGGGMLDWKMAGGGGAGCAGCSYV